KYAIPAFLVPLAFTFTPEGAALVAQGGFLGAVWTGVVSAFAVAALAAGAGGWIIRRAGWPERILCFIAAGALLYLQPLSMMIGFAALVLAVILHLIVRRRPSTTSAGEPSKPTAPPSTGTPVGSN
ncbi:MAG: C4-dicarboxylate ABC transporter permease, partial [Brevibacterium sp.]